MQKVPYPTYRFSIKPEQLGVWVDVLTEEAVDDDGIMDVVRARMRESNVEESA